MLPLARPFWMACAALLLGGRPVALRLNDGSRLEYLDLLTTSLGQTYWLAEYSYG